MDKKKITSKYICILIYYTRMYSNESKIINIKRNINNNNFEACYYCIISNQ